MTLDEEYTRLLMNLLPPGPAWEGDNALLKGLAPSLSRIHNRASDLIREIDPGSSYELLSRYEELCGLPDECALDDVETIPQRQRRLAAKVNGFGGINESFYLRQLDALDYPEVTITQFQNEAENPRPVLWSDDEYRFCWQVNIPAEASVDWMTCDSACNASLRTWGDTVIECVIDKLAPSHTQVIFSYQGDESTLKTYQER